jgi:hypothetical protein
VGVRLGYDENTWLLGVGTFREVWHRVFLPRTPIDFLLHSVLDAGMYSPEDGSEVGSLGKVGKVKKGTCFS